MSSAFDMKAKMKDENIKKCMVRIKQDFHIRFWSRFPHRPFPSLFILRNMGRNLLLPPRSPSSYLGPRTAFYTSTLLYFSLLFLLLISLSLYLCLPSHCFLKSMSPTSLFLSPSLFLSYFPHLSDTPLSLQILIPYFQVQRL